MPEQKQIFADYLKRLIIEECQEGTLQNYYEAQSCLNFCESELAKSDINTSMEQFVKSIALFYPSIAERLYYKLPSFHPSM